MSLRHRLGRRLLRLAFVRSAVEERADLSAFAGRPPPRLILGLVLIGLSFIVGGWPTLATIAGVAVYLKDAWVALLAPLAYGLSWGIWALGMLIAGPDTLRYGRLFGRYLARRSAEWLLRGAPDHKPPDSEQ